MSGDFDVFDEWGNFVGKFTPSGGGFEGCFMILALIFLWAFGFLVYLFFKLIINGFKALGRGEFGKALAYLIVPGAIILFGTLSVVGSVVTQAAQRHQWEVQQQMEQATKQAQQNREIAAAQEAINRVRETVESIKVVDVELMRPSQVPWEKCKVGGAGWSCDDDDYSYTNSYSSEGGVIKFTLVNDSAYQIEVHREHCVSQGELGSSEISDYFWGPDTNDVVRGGEEVTLYCFYATWAIDPASYIIPIWVGSSNGGSYWGRQADLWLYPYTGAKTQSP